MNRKLLLAALCVSWGILVFLVTWVLTFPGRAVADRAAAEVLTWSAGRSVLEMGDIGPWWVGLRATDVRLYDHDPRKPDLPSTLKFAADKVRARVSPWGLLGGNWNVTAALISGETTIDVAVTIRMDEERSKGWTTTRAWVSSPNARLEDVSMLAPLPMVMNGLVDLALDLTGEGGMRTAAGKASIVGKGLSITELTLEGMGDLGFGEIGIDVLDLELEVEEGRARFVKGEISGPMFDAEIGGDITLRDEPGRSNLRVTAVVEARGEMEKYAAFAGEARWADGKMHFVCTGYV
nr:type II secretion system protein GspN [Deltaproteobacteria bacterium]